MRLRTSYCFGLFFALAFLPATGVLARSISTPFDLWRNADSVFVGRVVMGGETPHVRLVHPFKGPFPMSVVLLSKSDDWGSSIGDQDPYLLYAKSQNGVATIFNASTLDHAPEFSLLLYTQIACMLAFLFLLSVAARLLLRPSRPFATCGMIIGLLIAAAIVLTLPVERMFGFFTSSYATMAAAPLILFLCSMLGCIIGSRIDVRLLSHPRLARGLLHALSIVTVLAVFRMVMTHESFRAVVLSSAFLLVSDAWKRQLRRSDDPAMKKILGATGWWMLGAALVSFFGAAAGMLQGWAG
ncbi:hypothetical protein HY213_03795 [Candidatus Peregrinibacteria bacterium]|nr:hypothetical protein [Candidatus Peregrinibacteria bacterium]